jgi:hypothetical protein
MLFMAAIISVDYLLVGATVSLWFSCVAFTVRSWRQMTTDKANMADSCITQALMHNEWFEPESQAAVGSGSALFEAIGIGYSTHLRRPANKILANCRIRKRANSKKKAIRRVVPGLKECDREHKLSVGRNTAR